MEEPARCKAGASIAESSSLELMRTNLRFLVPLIVGLVVLSTAFAFYQVSMEKRSLRGELERRAATLAESLVDSVEPLLARGATVDLRRIVQRNSNQERVLGIAIYDESGKRVAASAQLEKPAQPFDAFNRAQQHPQGIGEFLRDGGRPLYWFTLPVYQNQHLLGVVAVVCDASEIEAQGARLMRDTLLHGAAELLLIVVALLLIRSSVAGQIQHTAAWIRSVRTGKRAPPPLLSRGMFFRPLTREVTDLARSLDVARASAEQEARLREANESRWTAERLRVSVRSKLENSPLFVVANREP